jgi:hypothetical protein
MHEERPSSSTTPDDEAFAARFRQGWGRPEMNAVQAAEFDRRLESRRHRRERPLRLVPALVGLAVVGVMVAAVWVGHTQRDNDDGFLASLLEAEAIVATDVAGDDASAEDVAWADIGDGQATELDDETPERLSGHLSGEYQALAAWMFPADQDTDQEDDE